MGRTKELTEQQLLQTLDIPDWRHMSKDKIITFASNMPYLHPEVAKKALEQFPEFTSMSAEIINLLRDSLNVATSESTKSSDKAYEINSKILDGLEKRLNKPFLLPGERQKIIDAMLEVSHNVAEIDKTQKSFLLQGLKTVGAASIGIVVLAASILGVNIKKD